MIKITTVYKGFRINDDLNYVENNEYTEYVEGENIEVVNDIYDASCKCSTVYEKSTGKMYGIDYITPYGMETMMDYYPNLFGIGHGNGTDSGQYYAHEYNVNIVKVEEIA